MTDETNKEQESQEKAPLYAFSIALYEDKPMPVLDVVGQPPVAALVGLARYTMSRFAELQDFQVTTSLIDSVEKLDAVSKKQENIETTLQTLTALLGKVVSGPEPTPDPVPDACDSDGDTEGD